MSNSISVVIPTITTELAISCVNSVIENTTMDGVEIIVVANGASSHLKDFIRSKKNSGINIRCIWFDNPLGPSVAYNIGMKEATGDFIVLLNDDCVIYGPKDKWINMLLQPFSDPTVGCTGPLKSSSVIDYLSDNNLGDFIVFFCAAIPKKVFDVIGHLNENLLCAIDVDFSIRLSLNRFKTVQTSEVTSTNDVIESDYNKKVVNGTFPIYHHGESTVHEYYGGNRWGSILENDIRFLYNHFKDVDTEFLKIPLPNGYFNEFEIAIYRHIVSKLPENASIVEIGSLYGRSICSIADIIKRKNLTIYSVDLFEDFSTPQGVWTNLLENFKNSIERFGISDHVRILRGRSEEIADLFDNSTIDMVFIDGDHSYESVIRDIRSWYPKVKPGGIISGHDHEWTEVKRAIVDFFGYSNIRDRIDDRVLYNLWYVPKPRIFDSFMVFNELDLLEIRLKEMYNTVTKFIIVEGNKRISGNDSPMYFTNNKDRFSPYMDKICHIPVDMSHLDNITDPWERERYLRDSISIGWKDLNDDDVVILSDVDEIPNHYAIANYKLFDGFCCLDQKMYYDYFNVYAHQWDWPKILPYGIAKGMTPNSIRHSHTFSSIKDGGWHFSFMGGIDAIKEKIASYSHQEYNNDTYLGDIEEKIEAGEDIFNRFWIKKRMVPIDDSYPKEISSNVERYIKMGYIKTDKKTSTEWKEVKDSERSKKVGKVLCNICTRNRYDTTLPLAIQSVLMQTVKPDKLLIYDDNDEKDIRDLRESDLYSYLFRFLSSNGIEWEVVFGRRKGQHYGHQLANESGYEFVWRLDDDEIAEPTVLERYLNLMNDDVGAVGGTVLTEDVYIPNVSSKIEHIYNHPNLQWTRGDGIVEVDHIHSTFLYRAGIVNYDMRLSRVAHREETIFTHELKELGYKLLIDRNAITYHLKQPNTGIRSESNTQLYNDDEKIFTQYMKKWGYKHIHLNCGLGDHYAFLNIVPKLMKKWKHLIIGVCYPEVFEGIENVTLLSIGESSSISTENIYEWMAMNNWNRSIVEAYASLYGVDDDNS